MATKRSAWGLGDGKCLSYIEKKKKEGDKELHVCQPQRDPWEQIIMETISMKKEKMIMDI